MQIYRKDEKLSQDTKFVKFDELSKSQYDFETNKVSKIRFGKKKQFWAFWEFTSVLKFFQKFKAPTY